VRDRPDWDDYWYVVAAAISRRADCSRRRVGAVIVDSGNRIISTGYNGSPPGGPSCLAGQCPRAASNVAPGSSYDTGPGACIALHAEQNAIIWADPQRLNGATIYVTSQPCDGCYRLIQGVGIGRLVVNRHK
jgi:dCMP deaminase